MVFSVSLTSRNKVKHYSPKFRVNFLETDEFIKSKEGLLKSKEEFRNFNFFENEKLIEILNFGNTKTEF